MVIAKMDGVCWTAIIAYRGIAVRIISVRRSTKKEARFYDRCNNRRKP
ncbi:BrnT family toxin [Adlercreutzia muris]|nr:BrnT family toxin [Adlercreutzia muris]